MISDKPWKQERYFLKNITSVETENTQVEMLCKLANITAMWITDGIMEITCLTVLASQKACIDLDGAAKGTATQRCGAKVIPY